MEDQTSSEQTGTNWCCILSTFIVAGGLCFFGVSLAIKGDGRTGLVLLLSSGMCVCGLLALSICAAIGKFRPREHKPSPASLDDPEDRPPSYRLSWRRSFMRRLRNRSAENDNVEEGDGGGGEEEDDEGGGGGGDDAERGGATGGGGETRRSKGGRWWMRRKKDEANKNRRRSCHGDVDDESTSSCDSLLAAMCVGAGARGGRRAVGGGSGGARSNCGQDGRCTQSLSNLLDPPSYQDAILNLDEAAIRKLRSEMCLPSTIQ